MTRAVPRRIQNDSMPRHREIMGDFAIQRPDPEWDHKIEACVFEAETPGES